MVIFQRVLKHSLVAYLTGMFITSFTTIASFVLVVQNRKDEQSGERQTA